MTTPVMKVESAVEELTHSLNDMDSGQFRKWVSKLARLFAVIGAVLLKAGQAIIFLDGKVEAVPPSIRPEELVKLAGYDPAKYCLFRLNPCTGKQEKVVYDPARPVKTAEQFVVSLCDPPQDGLMSRQSAIDDDRRALEAAGAKTEVVRLNDGREALLASLPASDKVPAVVIGTAVPAEYPNVGSDWILIANNVVLEGFAGQRKDVHTETGMALTEYSIHPNGGPSRAGPFVVAAYSTRADKFRKAS